jgi:hypothetical protein
MKKVQFSDKVIIHNLEKIIDPVLNNLLMKQKIKKDVNKTLC